MPGILPMKVIKVGNANTQTRIAQACDRCRSKKIRCDGLAPQCSQCSTVGFECKTSDKLSRRAFPRGYTESLEDRVRALETEVRELKDLVDEKDEKIDMLSRFYSQSPAVGRKSSLSQLENDRPSAQRLPSQKEETFRIHQPPFLSGEGEDAYFIGPSSGRALIDSFKRKLQESGNPQGTLDTAAFFPPYERGRGWLVKGSEPHDMTVAPPRLLSDQLINVFFQEWAPLFPILHRPTFLSHYEQYVSNNRKITDRRILTQLNLVFGIAALSQRGQLKTSVEQYEKRWSAAMEGSYLETSVSSLQCLILASIHAMLSASPMKLLHFRSRAVGMSQRLGLHLSQKRFPLGALTTETRKRIFWTLYTIDCFAAATFGLPRLISEADVECEYPVDADDEYVTEQGFLQSAPGASTKLSSALALFRCCRVLAKVLEENYPTSASYELSLSKTAALDAELEAWQETLAPHLRMEFVQDKPSTNVVSSRSPLLALTYHYIRTLIHRPAACGPLGEKASASVVALASSSKRIVQLMQLLDERNLNFSHCMNKDELLMVSGIGLLFQAMDLEKNGKFMKDVSRMVYTVADMLDSRHAPGAKEFRIISSSVLPSTTSSNSSVAAFSPPTCVHTQTQRQLQALAAKSASSKRVPSNSKDGLSEGSRHQIYGASQVAKHQHTSRTGTADERLSQSSPRSSTEADRKAALKSALQQIAPAQPSISTNLDYLPLDTTTTSRRGPLPQPSTAVPAQEQKHDTTVWDHLLESFHTTKVEDQYSQPYYDSLTLEMTQQQPSSAPYMQVPHLTMSQSTGYPSEAWAYNGDFLGSYPQLDHTSLGYSEGSLNEEDFSSLDARSNDSDPTLTGVMLPHITPENFQYDAAELQNLEHGLQYW